MKIDISNYWLCDKTKQKAIAAKVKGYQCISCLGDGCDICNYIGRTIEEMIDCELCPNVIKYIDSCTCNFCGKEVCDSCFTVKGLCIDCFEDKDK